MTRLVGILNLTPDSFSDGGRHENAEAMALALERMAEAGAVAVDVGAESTRPGATPVSPEEEWRRLEVLFTQVWPHFRGRLLLSIDTRHAAVAARALEQGADWINDVSGFTDAAMAAAVRHSSCMLVVMHALTVPADPAVTLPEDADVIGVLRQWMQARIAALVAQGIASERVIFDPGIGFGKTAEQSWQIVRRVGELKALGVPLLFGHSRKSFLGKSLDRDAATLAVSRQLAVAGVDFLRVHDVVAHGKDSDIVSF